MSKVYAENVIEVSNLIRRKERIDATIEFAKVIPHVFSDTFLSKAKIPCNKLMQFAYFWLAKASDSQLMTFTGLADKLLRIK